jgi:TRAP-type C4-dicarboxylate transport system permease small subunit
MGKLTPERRVLLVVVLLIAAFLSAGQAITFAWLSAFPERASQLESLEIRFWAYAAISVTLVAIAVTLIVKLVRNRKNGTHIRGVTKN